MSETTDPDAAEPAVAPADRKRGNFKWRQLVTKLPRQYIDRQGLVTHLAFTTLGGREPALAFLNAHHEGLGAKPIILAGESAAGYAAVRCEIQRIVGDGDESRQ